MLEILSNRTPDGYAKKIFNDLANRKLLKFIFSAKEKEFEGLAPEVRLRIFTKLDDLCNALESAVAKTYEYDKHFVIAKIVKFKPATQTESEIMVLQPSQPTPFHQTSTLFSSVDEAIKEQRIEVYGPAQYDERDKKKQQRDFHHRIFAMINDLTNPQAVLPLQEEKS